VGLRAGRPRGKSALEAHPHYHNWRLLGGLVSDGLHFARSRGAGGRSGRSPRRESLLGAEATPPAPPAEGRSPPRAGKKKKKKNGDKGVAKADRERDVGQSAAPAPDGAPGAEPAAAVGTAAGGGGRWVHVPN